MARVKKVPIEKLDDAIKEILNEFGKEGTLSVKTVTKKFGKEATKILKAESKAVVKRHSRRRTYYTQWANATLEETNSKIEVVFYSRKYQLPHLLEYSHATGKYHRGSYKGRPHISKAEEIIVKKYEEALKGIKWG